MLNLEIDYANGKFAVETGRLAKQADGAVLVTYGTTQVLVTAVASKKNDSSMGYFPLTCLYQFRTYANGKIPGGFFKREAKPSDSETLISRMIDRPIRPLFPDGFMEETQVVATVVSYSSDYQPSVAAILGASAALCISDIPYYKPVAAAIIGYDGQNYILNPSADALVTSQLNLLVVASKEAILMVESEAKELSEDIMLGALNFAFESVQPLIKLQEELIAKAGKKKREVKPAIIDPELKIKVTNLISADLKTAIRTKDKQTRYSLFNQANEDIKGDLDDIYDDNKEAIDNLVEEIKSTEMRKMILGEGLRVDGRKSTEIRPITCQTGVLANAHGSALFTRGETQALVVVTLGSSDDEQFIDEPPKGYYKKFYLHYNFPPFSVGEVGRMGAPGRREIGHGRLAERALAQVLPENGSFPYTIRIVSDILESNGSTSMASVCGGSLALQCADVPISQPVAGIAMGLVYSKEKSVILSDILGDEDHLGDMDFKVAGTKTGITALQMDIKIDGLPIALFKEALAQAKIGRMHILGEMDKKIDLKIKQASNSIPKFIQFKIPTAKIREVIGPGGSVIKQITAETGTKIDINDNGMVNIASTDQKKAEQALAMIQQKIGLLQIGQTYQGLVRSKKPIGFFVQCLPGIDGLLPLSEVESPDSLNEGDNLVVKVAGYDKQNRLQLTIH